MTAPGAIREEAKRPFAIRWNGDVRMDRAHRRFQSTSKALATVRRLAGTGDPSLRP